MTGVRTNRHDRLPSGSEAEWSANVDEEAHGNGAAVTGRKQKGIAVSKPSRLSPAATATFNVLKESLEHHIKEKEGEMFRTARGLFSVTSCSRWARMAKMKAGA